MHKIVLFISLGFVGLFALDNVWTKDTQGLSKKKSDEIIKSYEAGDNSKLDFADDPKSKTPYYGFKENIFVIGVSVGGASYSEDLSNITGSKTSSYSSYNAKLTIGKDFTLWHENYTQPTRIYLTYVFTKLDNDLDFTTWTVGIRENMEYWSLYETDSYKIYPTLSIEAGKSTLDRESCSITGFTTEFDLGLTYARGDNFEYFLNIYGNSINWKHPVDGISDKMSGYGLGIGLNYKLMYGDF